LLEKDLNEARDELEARNNQIGLLKEYKAGLESSKVRPTKMDSWVCAPTQGLEGGWVCNMAGTLAWDLERWNK